MEKKSRPGATCQAVVRGMHAWQGWLGKVWLGISTRGNHQSALEAALLDVVGMAQRSAHAGARGGVRVGRVTECAHGTTLRRVRRSVRRRDDGETDQQQARVQAARGLGRHEQHEQHDTDGARGEREHLRAVELVRWHAGALVQWRSGAVVQRCRPQPARGRGRRARAASWYAQGR